MLYVRDEGSVNDRYIGLFCGVHVQPVNVVVVSGCYCWTLLGFVAVRVPSLISQERTDHFIVLICFLFASVMENQLPRIVTTWSWGNIIRQSYKTAGFTCKPAKVRPPVAAVGVSQS